MKTLVFDSQGETALLVVRRPRLTCKTFMLIMAQPVQNNLTASAGASTGSPGHSPGRAGTLMSLLLSLSSNQQECRDLAPFFQRARAVFNFMKSSSTGRRGKAEDK